MLSLLCVQGARVQQRVYALSNVCVTAGVSAVTVVESLGQGGGGGVLSAV